LSNYGILKADEIDLGGGRPLPQRLRITVIIATYNRAAWLPAAIDSLLNQTRQPDEILVVNDGSSDNTAEVLSRYTTPVRVINQENNGLSAARNVALRDVQSDLLAFLDSDDSLPPHSIAERARVLEARPEFDVV
jgi:glycosyltransferase involved in cell wall biosynthesis